MAARRLGGSILLLLGGLGCGDGGPAPGSLDSGAGMDAARADGGGGGGGDGGGGGTDATEPPDGGTEACVHTGPPILDPAILPVCDLCTGAHCVPSGLVPEEQRDRLADCDADNKCVPDLFIET